MIAQVILVTMMMLLDIGRCLKLKPMPTNPARCGDLAIPFPFGTSSGCNLDYSFLDTCDYSYNPPRPFSNQSSDYYSGLQVNNFISGDTFSEFRRKFAVGLNQFPEWEGFPVSVMNEVLIRASSCECRATNSECINSSSGPGYYCKCLTGFEGNPYLVGGCHDIDECLVSEPCEGTCTNLVGSYSCSCPPSFEGDGKIDGSGCYQQSYNSLALTSSIGLYCIILGTSVPAFAISWIIWFTKQKKVVKLRRNLFIRNGGEVLEAKQSVQKTLSIFTAEDLKKATNNYDESNVLCQEDHLEIIYRGILPGVNGGVTIHNCHAFDRCKIEILISKLVALSQISHRNVVKLLGCCLETQVPLVVNEFFTCKTLLDCINDNSLSWDIRLRIAADTAGALAYLHSATPVPIIHGSLSGSSILLDDAYTVKVNGFGLTCSECTSCVQFHGDTPIYFYPDYISCGQLTEKTDVYSFGFILVELLTGKGVMSPEWLQVDKNLAKYFVGSSAGGDLLGILDDRLVTHDDIALQLRKVGEIAKRCLSSSSHERPTMKEVAISLEFVISS